MNGVPVAQGLPGGAPANPPHIYHSNISKHFKVTGEQECYAVLCDEIWYFTILYYHMLY